MCMTNEAAAIKLAERDNLVGELVEALVGLINAAENIDGEHVIGREQLHVWRLKCEKKCGSM